MTATLLERQARILLSRTLTGDPDAAAKLHGVVDAAFALGLDRERCGQDRIAGAVTDAARYLPCGIEKAMPVGDLR